MNILNILKGEGDAMKQTKKMIRIDKKEQAIVAKATLQEFKTAFDSLYVTKQAEEELAKGVDPKGYMPNSAVYKALTLHEFDHGVLLIEGFKDELKTFVVDLSKQIQREYGCSTASQRATAELAASSYARTLQSQMMITRYLSKGEFTDLGVLYMKFLSKELDRANRHYITAIQTLVSLKQPSMNITVKTNTANIAQQQLVQENINVNPK